MSPTMRSDSGFAPTTSAPCVPAFGLVRGADHTAPGLGPTKRRWGAAIAGHPRDPSTTTFALTGARWYRSITSWLIMRMQPDDTLLPMVHGSTVPWMR
jgi:hypothetical protein